MSETFLILRRNERDMIRNVYWSLYTRSCCQMLMKLVFSRYFFFEKYSNRKFHENPSSGSQAVLCGRTDRHDADNSPFRSFANAPRNSDSPGKYTPWKFERNQNFYGFQSRVLRITASVFKTNPFSRLFVSCGQSPVVLSGGNSRGREPF